MKILAGKLVWLYRRSFFIFPSAADVEENSLIVQPLTTANECGMAAEYDQITISALFYLFETRAIAIAVRTRSVVWVKAVSEHFLG